MIKLIFFDVGNVFLTYDKVFNRVVNDFGLDYQALDRAYEPYDVDANLGKIKIQQVWPKLCKSLNISVQNYNFIRSWVSDYEPIVPMHELAAKLSSRFRLGILSNYYYDFFEECLHQKFIPNLKFDPVIISAEVGYAKPDSEIYKIAEDRAGIAPSEIFYIDDKLENLAVAHRRGWQIFQFDYHLPVESTQLLTSILVR